MADINMSDAVRVMELNFRANIPIMWQGASGIGKTELLEAYAKKQGADYGFFEINLATAMLPDIIGYQIPTKQTYTDADGQLREIPVSEFAYPYFMFCKFTGRPAFTFQRGVIVLKYFVAPLGVVVQVLDDEGIV